MSLQATINLQHTELKKILWGGGGLNSGEHNYEERNGN